MTFKNIKKNIKKNYYYSRRIITTYFSIGHYLYLSYMVDANFTFSSFYAGGVFIATLFGLALAMITLAGEVLYYRKRNISQKGKQNDKRTIKKNTENDKIIMQKIASKLQMKPAPTDAVFGKQLSHTPRVSHISVYPRHFPFKE